MNNQSAELQIPRILYLT